MLPLKVLESEGKEEIFLPQATDVILLEPDEKVAGKRQSYASWEAAEADESIFPPPAFPFSYASVEAC